MMKTAWFLSGVLLFSGLVNAAGFPQTGRTITIGSKKFTESVILGEIAAHLVRETGVTVHHRRELGGTRLLWNALIQGEIDLYPEYTGTIIREIFADQHIHTETEIRNELRKYGIQMTPPLGFNNTYAIGMVEEVAEKLRIRKISDLSAHPELKFGFTNEFMDRQDGWPGLCEHYQLPQQDVRGLDHDLSYRGLKSGAIQVTDMYSTDAEIGYYGLRALEDDRHFFPIYNAVFLYREDLLQRVPKLIETLSRLAGQVSEKEMRKMNARAKIEKIPENLVAAEFVRRKFGVHPFAHAQSTAGRVFKHTIEHLILVFISLSAAILVAIPLGILSVKRARLGQFILAVVGVIQTIPSLALLVFMIPLLGIGGPPAIVALFLYSLLPIVRNTYAGIQDIPVSIRESAQALGLPAFRILLWVELPLASRAIVAGIKTSAVINVGTATLGALIGAGGYGQPILTGIRLDDVGLILQGAVPAALLALAFQAGFEGLEKIFVPRGLRLPAES